MVKDALTMVRVDGVCVPLAYDLLPSTDVYAGTLAWDSSAAAEVYAAWERWTRSAPDAAGTVLRVIDNLVTVTGCVLADADLAEPLLAPLRALRPELDTFAPMACADLVRGTGAVVA